MKLSIRAKVVLLLVLVALLPLVAAVLTISVGGRRLRTQSIGRSIRGMASAEALLTRVSLTKDIEKLVLDLSQPAVLQSLREAESRLTAAEASEIEQAWPGMDAASPAMRAVLQNPLASELRRIRREDPKFVEILVTDKQGRLVAATQPTTDFLQADERWWQRVAQPDRPHIVVPPVGYDKSSQTYSVDLCWPILAEGELVGVAKASLSIKRWLSRRSVPVGELNASPMLVRRDGTVLYRAEAEPLQEKVRQWTPALATANAPGWRLTRAGLIQGYAPVNLPMRIGQLPVLMPEWVLVLYLPKAEALGAVTRLSFIVMAMGLLIILMIFLAGLLLVDRVVVQRIFRLHYATQRVGRGELDYRVDLRRGRAPWTSGDELDELATSFNQMVDQIHRSHEELQEANELKMKFIRVAGHELRTPVSYILGMSQLLRKTDDPERLRQAMDSMGAKAHRLDEIIRTMFKLMPEQRYSQDLRYSEVKLSRLMEEVYLDVQPFIESRDQRLIMEGGAREDVIQADREKLRDAVENLAMNAIKFTPDGGTIRIRVARQLGGYISIAVQDEGPGIPESEMPHIFEPFYSGGDVMQHSSGTAGFEKRGMGLGLAVVRHFIELHGGSVSVSTGARGSTFTVTVPMEAPARTERPERPRPEGGPGA